MQRSHLVGGHQLDRARRQDAHAVERTAVADHLEEPRIVAGGGQQAGAAGKAAARTVDVMALAARAVGRTADLPAVAVRARPAAAGGPPPPWLSGRGAWPPGSRSRCIGARKNCVSFMPSGPVMRVRI